MARWAVIGGIVATFALAMVLDWLDGPSSHPDAVLIGALATLGGAVIGATHARRRP